MSLGFRPVGQLEGLERRHCRRLLHEDVFALLQAVDGGIEQVVWRHQNIDSVGVLFLHHLPIVGVRARNREATGSLLTLVGHQVAERHHLNVVHLGKRRVVDRVRHRAGADQSYLHLLHRVAS